MPFSNSNKSFIFSNIFLRVHSLTLTFCQQHLQIHKTMFLRIDNPLGETTGYNSEIEMLGNIRMLPTVICTYRHKALLYRQLKMGLLLPPQHLAVVNVAEARWLGRSCSSSHMVVEILAVPDVNMKLVSWAEQDKAVTFCRVQLTTWSFQCS